MIDVCKMVCLKVIISFILIAVFIKDDGTILDDYRRVKICWKFLVPTLFATWILVW
jgi:hypothetical protein